jgi:Arginase family
MLALRRLGRHGLVSIDGGLDFRHPGNAHLVGPVGVVAGEDLAVVTGRGTELLTDLWIHLDVDVVDPGLLPAVDSPEPGGLTWEELEALLRGVTAAELAMGLQVTIFDPDLDPDGRLAARLTDALVAGVRPGR